MNYSTSEDLGKLLLRLTVGILFLLHGINKLMVGIGPIESMLVARGIPAFFAWLAYVGEVLAPVLLIVGVYTRIGGLLVAINMVAALMLAHTDHFFTLSNMGGWRLELQALFLMGGVVIALLGAGRYSVGGKHGAFN
jgi:putative oxidoreductase